MTAELTADMSVAPEIAILAGPSLLIAAPPMRAGTPGQEGARPTLGTLARELRLLAAAPERWWGLVRFDPERSVRIEVEDRPEYRAWLVVLPPAQAGQQSAGQQSAGQDCDCDVATVIAGEATDGGPGSTVLRPGSTRVHGQPHRVRGHGAGYSISLHARANPPASGNTASGNTASGNPRPALSKSSARISSRRNVEVIGLSGHGGTVRDVPPERTHPDD
ncbi:MAG TPA: hypothetical protein VGF32_15920 [Streptosporangiaceae bacterium]